MCEVLRYSFVDYNSYKDYNSYNQFNISYGNVGHFNKLEVFTKIITLMIY